MNTNTESRGFAKDAEIVPKLEGMEVEFDEKVTLFPVELEEIRDVAPKGTQHTVRSGKLMF